MLYAIILFALLVTVLGAVRLRNIPLRRIGAYEAMQLTASEAVESGRVVHVSYGSSALRDSTTVSAIAAAEISYHLALRSALADKPTVITLSDPVSLGLAQDRLRRAYKLRNSLSKYRGTLAHWYPKGPLSFALAAGVGIAMLDEDFSTNILLGRFGPELMLIAENAIRYDRHLVAQSDQVDGQAVAYVTADEPLIGEEMYAGAAYLERTPLHTGGVIAQDVLRYLVIAALIALAILAFVGVAV